MINNRKLLIYVLILFLTVTISCSVATRHAGTAETNAYALSNVKFSLPHPEAWTVKNKTNEHITFSYKQPAATDNSSVAVEIIHAPETSGDEHILTSLENAVRKEFSVMRWLSRHYNRKEYKGQSCVEYDGIYQDTTSAETRKQFILYRGLILQNESDPEQLSHVRLKYTSTQKAIPNAVLSDYQNLVESLTFE